MIKNIIFALIGFVAIALILLWVLNGGIRRTYDALRNFSLFDRTSSSGTFLPWQPDWLSTLGGDNLFQDDTASEFGVSESTEAQLAQLQQEYESVAANAKDLANIGNPSPFFGKVRLRSGYSFADSETASEETLVLEASYENTAPLSLTGWSVQSAVSGATVSIPAAASPFWVGAVNTLSPVSIEPGDSLTLVSGISPVGVSFRENKCTGYLAQFQTFTPPLSLRCPTPAEELRLSTENLQQYGAECIDAAYFTPTCEFPKELPNVSPACRSHLQTILSYNGCVGRHASDSDFYENSWRLYLGSPTELWRNKHDAIRLLDADGKVVDVYVY